MRNLLENPFKHIKRNSLFFMLILLIMGIGAWLRVGGIISNSFSFTYDVGRDLLAVSHIIETGKIPLIGPTSGFAGIYYGPWWYYTLSIPFFLSGGNPQFMVLFIALSGILTCIAGYMIGNIVKDKILGLLMVGFLSFSPVLIGLSSQLWSPNLAPILVVIFIVFLIEIMYGKESVLNLWLIVGIGSVVGLIMDMAFVFGLIFLLTTVVYFILFYPSIVKQQKAFLFLIGLMFVQSPRIIFEIRHDFIMSKRLESILSDSNPVGTSSTILELLFNRASTFGQMIGGTFSNNNQIVLPVLLFVFSICLIVFKWRELTKKEQSLLLFCACLIVTSYTVLTFFSHDIWGHYLVGLPISYIVITSIGMHIGIRINRYAKFMYALVVLIWFLQLDPLNIIQKQRIPLWEGNAAVYRNQIALIDYIYKDARQGRFNYIVYTPPVHDYTYKYLFKWYGKNEYGYTPSIEKQKLFYVILEPDFENPQRMVDWLKVREGDGKIIKEESVKGGISVQQRIH